MNKNLTVYGLLLVLVISLALGLKKGYEEGSKNPPKTTMELPKIYPIVRVLVEFQGQPVQICSGTVISEKYVLTADHCFDKKDKTKKYFISDIYRQFLIPVTIHKTMEVFDIGVLTGDFKAFDVLKLRYPEDGISDESKNMRGCGYAYSGNLICFKFEKSRMYYGFKVEGKGQAFPGMSGGPLFDDKGYILGVLMGVDNGLGLVVINPLINTRILFNLDGVK